MKFSWKKVSVVLFILLFIIVQLVYWFNPVAFKDILAQRDLLFQWIQIYPVASACVYIGLYTISIVFGIPISATIIAGYFFGVPLGTFYSMIGTVLGISILVPLVRFALTDWVQSRYKVALKPFNNELKQYGYHYIIMVQLIPFAPSFLPYIAMALSDIPFIKVLAANILGTLPLTLLYVSAGSYIHNLNSTWNVVFYIAIIGSILALLAGMVLLYRRYAAKN